MGLKSKLIDYLHADNGEKAAGTAEVPTAEAAASEVLSKPVSDPELQLLAEYSEVAVYDPEEDCSVMLRIHGRKLQPSEQQTRYYYHNLWSRYISRNVTEEDKEAMTAAIRLPVVRAALEDRGRYSVLYHVMWESVRHCCQVLFLPLEGPEMKVLMAFRCVDEWEDFFSSGAEKKLTVVPSTEIGEEVKEEEVHLPDILHELRTGAQSYINAKRLNLSLDSVDVVNEDVFCDSRQVVRALSAVLEQAARGTAPGGNISVRVKQNPSSDSFSCSYMFIIRFRGEEIRPEKEILRLLRANHGSFTGNVGEHGNFSATLRFTFRNAGSPVCQDEIPALSGKRALVVDNDINTCFSVCRMLNSIGMRADWIGSGDEAVLRTRYAMEQEDDYHAFVIDWTVSDMSGMDTVRRIRSIIGDTKPIILLTAYDWPEIECTARRAGVTAFCYKPLFMSELQEVLTQPYKVVKTEPDEVVDLEGRRILLVEDNEMNLELTAELLTEAGLEVEAAGNGVEALDRIRESGAGYYDLILMDIQMPYMNGYEAAKLIRKLPDPRNAEIPIIAMTANVSAEDEQTVLDAGMNGYLTKPVDIHRMLERIGEVLK